ncbi:MAG TPA: endolytic transglycosylase MltG [Burkholderiales bacterium]|jgi:UPF0755 protein|nr:endolytic transglycosylase MltG [Burkholderiales bacterium]
MGLFKRARDRRWFSSEAERRRGNRLLRASLLLALAVAIAGGAWLYRYATTPVMPPEASRQFHINQGQGLRQVARSLESKKIISSADAFVLLARLLGKAEDVKAGTYEVADAVTPLTLLNKLARGEFARGQITFVEGWTFRHVRAALDSHPGLRHDTQTLTPEQILSKLDVPERHPEGLFFPDTYFFSSGTSDLLILRQAYLKMRQVLSELWPQRAKGLPLFSPYEALILASIVEKETGVEEEREMVAAVFVNRLKRGMRLQADPTVIYGLGEDFDGNLRRRDLLMDQPYNTYTRSGLPPTPVAMPGERALRATLNPAKSAALYFVARGDGSHVFSSSLSEHNRAVQKFQKAP